MLNYYYVSNYRGRRRLMSARKIYKIIKDPMNDFRHELVWNAKDLLLICMDPNFPRKYAELIEYKVMKFYSMLLYSNDETLKFNGTNLDCVCDLYNRLYDTKDEKLKAARSNFLNSFLEYITNSFKKTHNSSNFNYIANAWRMDVHKRLINGRNLNFYRAYPILRTDFKYILSIYKKNNTKVKKKVIPKDNK